MAGVHKVNLASAEVD